MRELSHISNKFANYVRYSEQILYPQAKLIQTTMNSNAEELTKAEQRSGAPAPKGELSGERDSFGTAEAMDQGG